MTHEYKVAIIGGGRLGSAVARGFRYNGLPNDNIVIAQRNLLKLEGLLKEGFVAFDKITNYEGCDAIVIAVKPIDLPAVLTDLRANAQNGTIVVSAASGVTCELLENTLGANFPLYRIKLSIFSEVRQQLIPLHICNSLAQESPYREKVSAIFAPIGKTCEMSEMMMELSGWDLSSLAGIIVPQLAMERLANQERANTRLIETLILSGLHNLVIYCEEKLKQGMTLGEVAADLEFRIASPGGLNDAMSAFLNEHEFWQLSTHARSVYIEKLVEIERHFAA